MIGYTTETAPSGLRASYKTLEPDPNAEYGTLLPFARDKVTGETRWAMPSLVRDFLTGGLDLLAGLDTGAVTPRAALQLGLGGMGAGASLAPRGALAMGGARNELAKDTVSRLARARQMGFQVDRPQFHATTAPDFPAFGAVPPWDAIRGGKAPGIWTAENPAVANKFAEAEVRSRLGLSPTSQSPELLQDQAYSRVLPLFARSERTADLTLPMRPDWGDVWHRIAANFHDGYDAVRLQNYRMFPELGPQTIWSFRDPAQLRSRFALFDPEKRNSSDLLAGFAVPAPIPGFRVTPQDDATGLTDFRRMMDEERVY